MATEKNAFFNLVKVPSEKKRIFRELIDSHGEILMKGHGEGIFRLRPEKISEKQWILCHFDSGSSEFATMGFDELHSANFAVGKERYFFQSSVQVSPESILLETPVELYHLQRRKSMRISLPLELGASCNIINHNDISGLHACEVLDFSPGGLKVLFDGLSPFFHFSDRLVIVLRLGTHRKSLEIKAAVRHVHPPKKGQQIIGLQFLEMDRILENKLQALQLDLQTEIFRKFKRHQR
jgi:c-di-GMP-binding flagellar brake protein YcgR